MRLRVVLLIFVMALPPMLIGLGVPGPQHNMEAIALLASRETWNRQRAGESSAWLLPTQNGAIRVRKPPMLVWMDFVAWRNCDSTIADSHQLMLRARLVSAFAAVVLMLSTLWIGRSVERLTEEEVPRDSDGARCRGLLGPAAAMVVGTMLLTQQQARMASYDMPFTAFATLSVAAIMAALHQGAMWTWCVAAVALAIAWLTKGPLAGAIVIIPAVLAIVVFRNDRRRAILGVVISLAGALVMIAPWYVYLKVQKPDAWATLWHEYEATLTNSQPWYFYGLTLPRLALPWTVWVIAGLALPLFRKKCVSQRMASFIALWLAAIVVAFSCSPGKSFRYILPVAPPMALAAALAWVEIERSVRANALTAGGRTVVALHWVFVSVMSLGFGALLWKQSWLVEHGWMKELIAGTIGGGVAIVMTIALSVLSLVGVVLQRRDRVRAACLVSGVWAAALTTVYWHADAHKPRAVDAVETAARKVHQQVGPAALAYLRESEGDQPEYEFLFFLNRVIDPVRLKGVAEYMKDHPRVLVMAEDSSKNNRALEDAHLEIVTDFSDGAKHKRLLWRSP